MKYDFTTMLDRTGKDAIAVELIPIPGAKIDEGFSRIPMWIADMNFVGAPSITEALKKRIETPAYGYFPTKDEYFNSIIHWQESRNGVTGLERKHIGYENGVLGGVASAMRVLCSNGGKVLVHSPTYVGFTSILERNGYTIVHSPLKRDEQGVWRMDYDDMDKKLKENKIHVAVFCNPHNPVGRVWERWELEQAMEVYRRNDCYVISDEIWSDLILNGHHHIPVQMVSEDARQRTIALYAPSKTFNLAGLIGSYHIIYNDWLRDRMEQESALCGYNSMNVLSMHALIGAYQDEGAEWVDELCQTLSDNANFAYDYICEHFEGVTLAKPEGTYMLFLDCEQWCKAHNKTMDELLLAGPRVGVVWQDGRAFHGPYGIRMNLAVPNAYVREAFQRLDKYVFNA